MNTMSIGDLKSRFSAVLEKVKEGQKIVISYGKKKEKVAVIIPYKLYKKSKIKRKIGLWEGRAKCIMTSHFSMTDEEFLSP